MKRLSLPAAFIAALFIVLSAQPGSAQTSSQNCTLNNEGRTICGGGATAAFNASAGNARASARSTTRSRARTGDRGTIIGGRPPDCPHRYCGCGLRKHLGLNDKRLNLALNWARLFPRVSAPRAGVAAVRNGHVMYIESSAGDGEWMVRDYNSGGGLSRLHVRDVRGYIYVNPHAMIASR